MARKKRIEKIGFYHIINRGVARNIIFQKEKDNLKFLEIIQDASQDYNFEVFSYCLMNNHYHLLIKTNQRNLSILMQKINSRYSMYFNHKYKRVGPLWQGRFKSWFVYDEIYLKVLVKYIEFNPIKANITKKIGQYKWAMSSKDSVEFSMLNFELIDNVNFKDGLSDKDEKQFNEFIKAKIELKDNNIVKKEPKELQEYFEIYNKDEAISSAIKDEYTQVQIAKYLNLSNVSISKMIKIYKQKIILFNKLRDKGIFWSYDKNISYNEAGENLTIEYLLKYGDFDDIVLGIKLFGKKLVKKIWEHRLKSDRQFIKLNLMLARVFFNMDVESSYFKEVKNERFEKLKLLAS